MFFCVPMRYIIEPISKCLTGYVYELKNGSIKLDNDLKPIR